MIQTAYLEIERVATALGRNPDRPRLLKKVTETTLMAFALTGCRIFTGERFLEDHAVVIDGERITAVVPRSATSGHRDRVTSAAACSRRASSTCR